MELFCTQELFGNRITKSLLEITQARLLFNGCVSQMYIWRSMALRDVHLKPFV